MNIYVSRWSPQLNISGALCNLCGLLNGAPPVGEGPHTWEQGVLYAEHGRPAAGVHGLHQLLLVGIVLPQRPLLGHLAHTHQLRAGRRSLGYLAQEMLDR